MNKLKPYKNNQVSEIKFWSILSTFSICLIVIVIVFVAKLLLGKQCWDYVGILTGIISSIFFISNLNKKRVIKEVLGLIFLIISALLIAYSLVGEVFLDKI